MSAPYSYDIDFAFFAANFGYTKADYNSLTPKERLFILKAWENKQVTQTSLMYRACFTAFYNANRPKRKKALKLWDKQPKKADKEAVRNDIAVVRAVDEKEGSSWVKKVYQANGLLREGGKNGK